MITLTFFYKEVVVCTYFCSMIPRVNKRTLQKILRKLDQNLCDCVNHRIPIGIVDLHLIPIDCYLKISFAKRQKTCESKN
ncbi:hypothetical protein L596_003900 [Steinernema carpocapsae]|uniref:Uncharacterized protein n=1 Tax=Steinernema carpocapsae TaxID=34508 RepID=A0A4U8UU07_STECR|nr:hypothetical protein L596_003900 [Steinernema carpocapsae]